MQSNLEVAAAEEDIASEQEVYAVLDTYFPHGMGASVVDAAISQGAVKTINYDAVNDA